MAKVFDQAKSATEQARRRALEAMAGAGADVASSLTGAQQQVRSDQESALNGALRSAVSRGAPQGAQDEVAGIIGDVGDRTAQNLAAQQRRMQASLASQQGEMGSYFDQALAAVPAIQADADRTASYAAAKWAAQKAKEGADQRWEQLAKAAGTAELNQQAELTQRQSDLNNQLAATQQQLVASTAAGAPGGARPGIFAGQEQAAYGTHVSGLGQQQDELTRARALIAQQIADSMPSPALQAQRQSYVDIYGDSPTNRAMAAGLFPIPPATKQVSEIVANQQLDNLGQTGYRSASDAAREQGAQRSLSGTPQDRALAAKAGFNTVDGMLHAKASPQYKEMHQVAADIASAGQSLEDLKYQLDIDPKFEGHPLTKRLVLTEYAGLLPSSGYISPG